MSRLFIRIAVLIGAVFIASCGTTDNTMREQGRSDAYMQGFHDGRHSGMREAGNNWEHFVRDYEKFTDDSEYRDGWNAGEVEGKHLQEQANALNGSTTAYKAGKGQSDVDKAAKDAMRGVDTSVLKNLEK